MEFDAHYLYRLSTLIMGVSAIIMGVTIIAIREEKNGRNKQKIQSLIFFSVAMIVQGTINLAEYFKLTDSMKDLFHLALVIPAASIELFLILYGYLSLLDSKFAKRKRIFSELAQIVLFTSSPFFINPDESPELFTTLLMVAFAFYIVKLVWAILLYRKYIGLATERLERYYSEDSSTVIKWIKNTIFIAIFIGVTSTLIPLSNLSVLLAYNITLIFAYLYIYLLIVCNIRIFDTKMRIANDCVSTTPEDKEQKETGNTPLFYKTATISDKRYDQWLAQQTYTKAGVTADEIAAQLGINRSKLSTYLKDKHNASFYEWIAQLRIEEAKQQLINHPERPIFDIAVNVGIEDKSNFTRTFKRITGVSPLTFRNLYKSDK